MRVLFVCTGNTCRSSMAEGLLKAMGEHEVRSAGVAAEAGSPASPYAVDALFSKGIDITTHRARFISAEDVEWADIILTMTRRHKELLLERFPHAEHKLYTLKEKALSEEARARLATELDALYRTMDEKRRAFAKNRPSIAELQERRQQLQLELEAVEQQLAELQSDLRKELLPERHQIAKLESFLHSHDVADPFGQPQNVYKDCAEELSSLIGRVFLQQEKGDKTCE